MRQWLLLVLLSTFLGLLAIWADTHPFELVMLLPGSSCTLGLTGTAAKLTWTGWQAETICEQQLANFPANQRTFYRVLNWQPSSAEVVRCQYTQGLVRVTVTDTGMGLVSLSLCPRT